MIGGRSINMSKKEVSKRKLLHTMGTLDFFKKAFFNEESVNYILLQAITDNLMEVYNYVDTGSTERTNNS